jgi:hypothetical protein
MLLNNSHHLALARSLACFIISMRRYRSFSRQWFKPHSPANFTQVKLILLSFSVFDAPTGTEKSETDCSPSSAGNVEGKVCASASAAASVFGVCRTSQTAAGCISGTVGGLSS